MGAGVKRPLPIFYLYFSSSKPYTEKTKSTRAFVCFSL
ncbi:hypothetical protein BAXH7_01430 [Bacillus amyloliquefaciens XH7]|nr:hypothetical protein BAMTA208_07030 [Bacillus amyloliquefaciens TA208]AEK88568.1 hypothetical protein BAXH7_01430 [Bacillus amyloliquefaciens XH7]KYC95871.1 hypothetical protein B425_2726 [Bacillus amyloliquefaciens]